MIKSETASISGSAFFFLFSFFFLFLSCFFPPSVTQYLDTNGTGSVCLRVRRCRGQGTFVASSILLIVYVGNVMSCLMMMIMIMILLLK
ncbi:hypothetical protein F5X96DRAFT_664785 [Biscogniauxia mediterranea]|nr:hypothetical protein F5X96DRAFT_664785 [Biscogniauxia mediterranea]